MTDQNQTAKTQGAANVVYFDDRTALQIAQAFNQETELPELLDLLFGQLQAMTETRGLRFAYKPLGIDLNLGERDRHSAEYNLTFRDTPIGTLTLFFAMKQHEQSIQTCEDLVSLAFVSLRNAVTLLELRTQQPREITTELTEEEAAHVAEVTAFPTSKEANSDALVLVALDDYERIKSRDGEEWAHVLMSSVHEQIQAGLRAADGVYHINDDLIAVLLPNTNLAQAEAVAKKVRLLIASLHLRGDDLGQQLTACMGVADATAAGTAEEVMDRARSALARAKAEGANQIEVYRRG